MQVKSPPSPLDVIDGILVEHLVCGCHGKCKGHRSTPKKKVRLVFHYEYHPFGGFYKLVKVYPLLAETKSHLQVRHWYGKRWYPKNEYWRIEEE